MNKNNNHKSTPIISTLLATVIAATSLPACDRNEAPSKPVKTEQSEDSKDEELNKKMEQYDGKELFLAVYFSEGEAASLFDFTKHRRQELERIVASPERLEEVGEQAIRQLKARGKHQQAKHLSEGIEELKKAGELDPKGMLKAIDASRTQSAKEVCDHIQKYFPGWLDSFERSIKSGDHVETAEAFQRGLDILQEVSNEIQTSQQEEASTGPKTLAHNVGNWYWVGSVVAAVAVVFVVAFAIDLTPYSANESNNSRLSRDVVIDDIVNATLR